MAADCEKAVAEPHRNVTAATAVNASASSRAI